MKSVSGSQFSAMKRSSAWMSGTDLVSRYFEITRLSKARQTASCPKPDVSASSTAAEK